MKDADGRETRESTYYLSANRAKKSVTVDIATTDGQHLIRELARRSDIVVENYKVGTLSRYGLAFEHLSALNPRLIYCSLTGFGQTGPYAPLPGYDFVFQGMGGLMSITGLPDGAMYLLPRAIGLARAKDMVFTARTVVADDALALGLVQSVHPAGSLLDASIATAERFARAPSGALGVAKQMMNRAFEAERRMVFEYEALAQALCRESSFHREAVERFVRKDTPLYDWDRAAAASAGEEKT